MSYQFEGDGTKRTTRISFHPLESWGGKWERLQWVDILITVLTAKLGLLCYINELLISLSGWLSYMGELLNILMDFWGFF